MENHLKSDNQESKRLQRLYTPQIHSKHSRSMARDILCVFTNNFRSSSIVVVVRTDITLTLLNPNIVSNQKKLQFFHLSG